MAYEASRRGSAGSGQDPSQEVIECEEYWKIRAASSLFLAVLFGLFGFAVLSVARKNHGISAKFVALELGLDITAVLLLIAAYRIPRMRFLRMNSEGVSACTFWRTRRFTWDAIADVYLRVIPSNAGIFFKPYLRLRTGKRCGLLGLAGVAPPWAASAGAAQRAQQRVERILTAKAAYER